MLSGNQGETYVTDQASEQNIRIGTHVGGKHIFEYGLKILADLATKVPTGLHWPLKYMMGALFSHHWFPNHF